MATPYAADAETLGELGRLLVEVPLPTVRVRLPVALAERAGAAWERLDEGQTPPGESPAQRLARHRAGTLAPIGLRVQESGRRDGEHVTVDPGAGLVALAVDASDDLPAP